MDEDMSDLDIGDMDLLRIKDSCFVRNNFMRSHPNRYNCIKKSSLNIDPNPKWASKTSEKRMRRTSREISKKEARKWIYNTSILQEPI